MGAGSDEERSTSSPSPETGQTGFEWEAWYWAGEKESGGEREWSGWSGLLERWLGLGGMGSGAKLTVIQPRFW